VLLHLLLALAVVMAVGQIVGWLFRHIGQPPVIGEVIGGIMLGPSLLGWISPAAYAFILPPAVVPQLNAVAQLGVVLYMFLVGLELNPDRLRGRLGATVAISHASIVLPFGLGALLAMYLHPRFSSADVPFLSFVLFAGIAMSITAFPVLARILSDRRMTTTDLGVMALSCAAIDDVTAWCLLAFVVGVVQASVGSAMTVAALTAVFIGVMFVVVRPLVSAFAARRGDDATPGTIAAMLMALLLAALTTEAIGVHALFGAFLFGAVIPHDSPLAASLMRRLHHVVTILLLPAFFAFTGMRTEIGLLSSWEHWAVCALIVFVATVGKFGGTLIAGRLTGLGWRFSAALGVLMNTRGLMELIVLNIGLELGVISPMLFTMFVLMALVTTIATTPIVVRLVGASERAVVPAPAS
jgi:Kef-type K+ transport system membrane component KefB